MSSSVYKINKGINQSIVFKGLKAQYIWYLGAGVLVLMVLFASMYIAGVPSLLCIALIGIAGTLLVVRVYKMSHKYGEYGMMKALARRQLPSAIKCYGRSVFFWNK
ncbi:DUF4133 domain-containing protein [Flavobacterium beibuense]|uniref:DUF4133 domain-containing protein n=1 Tax=Flavobacterium beibuense TaxID=657326 RepID=A0A444WF18_9FLAO|nr:DUF4133 domain-containing protein [Flavobacterium beibuense]RYJ44304.1 hypothetical protein NU09_0914 [Flavobacterium beibuense]